MKSIHKTRGGWTKLCFGFYPTPTGIEAFKDELSNYKGSKGSVQFPINKPMPFDLIRKIVEFRVIENKEKAGSKS